MTRTAAPSPVSSFSRLLLCLPMALLLSACATDRAPSFLISGSYFPAWMMAAVIGIAATIAIRIVLIRAELDDYMPLRVPAYTCLALAVTFALLLLGFPF